MASPLTNSQKRYLSQLAERAYRLFAARARGRGEESDMRTKAIEAYRHAEVIKAVAKAGLRCCSQDDYGAVKAHFLHLLGEDGQAMKAHVHAQSNGRRVVEFKILEVLKALGKPAAYANAICRQMFGGLGLIDASEKQLWKIFYALNKQRQRTQ